MPGFVPSTPPKGDHPQLPSYGGRPALKPSIYGWLVGLYMVFAGVAGSAQILATLLDLAGGAVGSPVVLGARIVAVLCAVGGGVLLIYELHTPKRFYNMLRIFRPTSPMSIGTYTLTSFGFFSVLALLAHLLGWTVTALVLGAIASLPGLSMMSYPAAFAAATSTPLWAAAPASLGARFAASSMASGAAMLVLIALLFSDVIAMRALALTAALALAVELVASIVWQTACHREGVAGPLRDRYALLHLLGAQIAGSALPLALFVAFALFAAPALLVAIAAILTLGGSLIMRSATLIAGNESAKRPRDYFHFTRSERDPDSDKRAAP
jgi:protein NrfD